jgi:putative Mn2+ efflux pump MntP
MRLAVSGRTAVSSVAGRRIGSARVADAIKLIAIVLPLGLDTLGVALALGIAGLPAHRRKRVALLFTAFETIMPLVGVAIGAPLGDTIGSAADYVASGLLIALGAYMLGEGEADDEDEGERLLSMTRRGVYGAAALGVSISLDELAIGFSAGLLRLPLLPLVIAIGVQTFIVTQAGIRLGSRLGARWRESAERVAGVALIALGVVLLALRIAS